MAAKRLIEIGALLSRSPGHVGVEAPVFKYAAVLLLLSWPATAEVHLDYTFSQWEKLHEDDRAAYIARSIEMLGTIAGPEPAQRAARHYSQCIVRSQLTASQLVQTTPFASVGDILEAVGEEDRRDFRYCHLAFAIRTDLHSRHYGTCQLGAHDVSFRPTKCRGERRGSPWSGCLSV